MHRVELKGSSSSAILQSMFLFLMHRVELKERQIVFNDLRDALFLMHRVELKESFLSEVIDLFGRVPNAPCGVESYHYCHC